MEIKSRFDHFNINVTDLARSLDFYDKALGLKEVGRKEASDGSFTLVYLGDGQTPFRLELTWLRDHTLPYELGENESHLCMRVAATTTPSANTTARWAASATRTTPWDSTSSTTRTITGSKSCPSNSHAKSYRHTEGGRRSRARHARGRDHPLPHRYGLGTGRDATSAAAVERIYRLKRARTRNRCWCCAPRPT